MTKKADSDIFLISMPNDKKQLLWKVPTPNKSGCRKFPAARFVYHIARRATSIIACHRPPA